MIQRDQGPGKSAAMPGVALSAGFGEFRLLEQFERFLRMTIGGQNVYCRPNVEVLDAPGARDQPEEQFRPVPRRANRLPFLE